jgi:LAGLIDADG DNA endonuclease family
LETGIWRPKNAGRTWRLKVEHGIKQKEYVMHQYEIFSALVKSPPREIHKENSVNFGFQTISSGSFRFYGQQFYKSGRKIIPKMIEKFLTPRTLAYWYSDDGSCKSKESKEIIFSTQGFLKQEVKILCEVLQKKFSLDCWPRKQREGYQIYVSGKSYSRIKELIYPYLIPAMLYKFPTERKIRKLT